jgi:hypothetical protein
VRRRPRRPLRPGRARALVSRRTRPGPGTRHTVRTRQTASTQHTPSTRSPR